MDFYVDSLLLHHQRQRIWLFLYQSFYQCLAQNFPSEGRGLRKHRRKNVQREGDRKERKLLKGNSELEIVTKISK